MSSMLMVRLYPPPRRHCALPAGASHTCWLWSASPRAPVARLGALLSRGPGLGPSARGQGLDQARTRMMQMAKTRKRTEAVAVVAIVTVLVVVTVVVSVHLLVSANRSPPPASPRTVV